MSEEVQPDLADGHRLDRIDARWLIGLTFVAFVLRYFSPIFPDFIAHPFTQAPISNCVHSTPVDTVGHTGSLCGLAYPFQRGYPTGTGVYSPPNGQVFDEIYFAVFAHDDLKGIAYFDPEPPLSKLIIAGGQLGWGWFQATFQGAHGDYADLGYNTFGWRIMSCIFGTLCVPMIYLLARRLWRSARLFAVAAATLVTFDGMFFIQSRIGMIDIFPIFFILCLYWLFMVHLDSRTVRRSLLTLLALGFVAGIAIASKWIALAAYASILLLFAMRVVRRHLPFSVTTEGGWTWGRGEKLEGPTIPGRVPVFDYAVIGVVAMLALPIAIYIVSWAPFFVRGQFHWASWLVDIWNYNKEAYQYHATLTATHPYGSPWWTWPFLLRPVAYYYQGTGLGFDQFTRQPLVAGMVNLGNPWIWWTSLPCLVALPFIAIRQKNFVAALIFVGFLAQYLPWSRISRVVFLYHMFGGLPFMILALAFVMAYLVQKGAPPALAWGHLVVAVAAFLYFIPVWTALPIATRAYLDPPPAGKMWIQWNCTQPARPTPSSWVPCWI
ncbi:MAG TPA: phospholipid carrier-dependent glycosyltransferase [Candidatus Dormibacteraeota bacterium]